MAVYLAPLGSSVRFTLKSLGIKLASPNTDCFAKRARLTLEESEPEVLALIERTLEVIDVIRGKVKELTRRIEQMGETK